MIQSFSIQISEIHQKIREEQHRLHMFERCIFTLQNERKTLKQAQSLINKKSQLKQNHKNICSLFQFVLNNEELGRINSRQSILISELNLRAATKIIPFLNGRLGDLEDKSQRLRTLIAMEKRVIIQFEKLAAKNKISNAHMLTNYFLKTADLKTDLSELNSARQLANNARENLIALIHHLQSIKELCLPDNAIPTGLDKVLNQIFVLVIEVEMFLCALKNELKEFSAGRVMNFHLDALVEFKASFFNYLIADWISYGKIKRSGVYCKNLFNSLEALMKGLEKRNGRIENELSLITLEKEAMIARLNLIASAE